MELISSAWDYFFPTRDTEEEQFEAQCDVAIASAYRLEGIHGDDQKCPPAMRLFIDSAMKFETESPKCDAHGWRELGLLNLKCRVATEDDVLSGGPIRSLERMIRYCYGLDDKVQIIASSNGSPSNEIVLETIHERITSQVKRRLSPNVRITAKDFRDIISLNSEIRQASAVFDNVVRAEEEGLIIPNTLLPSAGLIIDFKADNLDRPGVDSGHKKDDENPRWKRLTSHKRVRDEHVAFVTWRWKKWEDSIGTDASPLERKRSFRAFLRDMPRVKEYSRKMWKKECDLV